MRCAPRDCHAIAAAVWKEGEGKHDSPWDVRIDRWAAATGRLNRVTEGKEQWAVRDAKLLQTKIKEGEIEHRSNMKTREERAAASYEKGQKKAEELTKERPFLRGLGAGLYCSLHLPPFFSLRGCMAAWLHGSFLASSSAANVYLYAAHLPSPSSLPRWLCLIWETDWPFGPQSFLLEGPNDRLHGDGMLGGGMSTVF